MEWWGSDAGRPLGDSVVCGATRGLKFPEKVTRLRVGDVVWAMVPRLD